MNYIKHLNSFFEKIEEDERITPFHISLYLALFIQWNVNRFRNPLSISRTEIMSISKIGSTHTYTKCLKQLHEYGYISYKPSFNSTMGSIVHLCTLDKSDAQETSKSPCIIDNGDEKEVLPSINSINKTNNTRVKNDFEKKSNTISYDLMPPAEDDVKAFFETKKNSEVEALRFYNHYSSIGWKINGKTPIENWQASAVKWMLHNVYPKNGHTTLNIDKKYDEPL